MYIDNAYTRIQHILPVSSTTKITNKLGGIKVLNSCLGQVPESLMQRSSMLQHSTQSGQETNLDEVSVLPHVAIKLSIK